MKCIIPLLFAITLSTSSAAQDERGYYQQPTSPVEYYRRQMEDNIIKQLNKLDWNKVERKTSGGTTLYTVPVVVHVLHNYGAELIGDTTIYNFISGINSYFLKTNPDTINIIDKFKPVAANTQIEFRLATIDPYGNQTKGIEHIFTYLTYADLYSQNVEQGKINQWPQSQYLNIWTLNIGYFNYGYAYTPFYGSYYPYWDGVMLNYGITPYSTLGSRYLARYLNLPYPCTYGICGDGDMLPDTPPCDESIYYTCANIYDSTCDTPNVQNVMVNYDSCGIMFTYDQGQYMQYILQIDIGNRDSLVTPYNFTQTGIGQPMPDMLPVPDFSINSPGTPVPPKHFYCPGQPVFFKNQSWNDTVIAASWTFSNNASSPSSTSLTSFYNTFSQPGWVTVSLSVTGNNTGTSSLTDSEALFIADSAATDAEGYVQEFAPGTVSKWPMFNYYNNNFKWQLANVGYFDNSSLEYADYDYRTFPANTTGTPQGDVDDVFTPPFGLTGFPESCYLNFMSSGATISDDPRFMNDTLQIDYSINKALTWINLATLTKEQLFNKGTVTAPYTPSSPGDWLSNAIPIPLAARTAYTLFRFRYHPAADTFGVSTGNNFYLDNFNINAFPESVKNPGQMENRISLMPNPTHGIASVVINDSKGIQQTIITITDIAGNEVYKNTRFVNSNLISIQIPGNVFPAKGLYLVKIVTANMERTEKLVVY